MSLLIDVRGDSHLAETTRAAAQLHGFHIWTMEEDGEIDLTFAAQDVEDHADLSAAKDEFDYAAAYTPAQRGPLVLLSQVPPGTTRAWAAGREQVYYQVDTIIMQHAVARMATPARFIVGAADPSAPLPIAYQAYLAAHQCPVFVMSYESAELAKCAINYVLSEQIRAARDLAAAAERVGADYEDVRVALHSDARIGPRAYLRPGHVNQHLKRDVATIIEILTDQYKGEVGLKL